MSFLRAFLTDLDPRVLLSAFALVVALLALRLHLRRDAREHDRERRSREDAAQKQSEDERRRLQFLAGFEELPLQVELGGGRRIVWRYPATWRDNAPEEPAIKPLDEAETFWLNHAIWHALPDLWPTSYDPRVETSPQRHLLYETDPDRTYKRRLLTQATSSVRYVVGLVPRKGETAPAFCIPCRVVVSSAGTSATAAADPSLCFGRSRRKN
jgi:hypothetical protein